MPLSDSGALLLGLAITGVVFVIRSPVVRLTLRQGFSKRDAAVAAIMTPKGLAAAVLAALPLQAGLAGGHTIQAVVYAIILFSILVTAILSFVVGRGLIGFPWTWVFSSYPARTDDDDDGLPNLDAMTLVTMTSGTSIKDRETWPPDEPEPLFDDESEPKDVVLAEPAWASPREEPQPGPATDDHEVSQSVAPQSVVSQKPTRNDDKTLFEAPDQVADSNEVPLFPTSDDADDDAIIGSGALALHAPAGRRRLDKTVPADDWSPDDE